ncbi:MAG: efflux transporter outer membrane subunit [Proteobacteria bacterium]|nr:efflux transporter outer membrane subunit [Pseudomonadota bacterium]
MLTGCAIEIPLDASKPAPAAQPPAAPAKRTGGSSFATTLLVLIAMTLSGCAVGPDYQTPQFATPAQWSRAEATNPSQPPQLAQWWRRLRDPLLDRLVDEAVAGNLDVAAAKARIREARASYRQAVGALFPAVTNSDSVRHAKGASSQSQAASSAPAVGNTSPSTLYQAGFDASWELDLFGANRRSVEAAVFGIEAADQELRSVLLTLVGDVTSNYVQARGYQARIALARRTAASQDETTQITRNRLAAGTATAADVANASGQAATTRAVIPTLEISYAEAVHRISVLTGRSPAALDDRLAKARPIPAPKLPIPTGVPADILLARPDVRLAERLYAQSTARIGQAEAALYPNVSLTGNIATAGAKLGDLGRNSSINWSFGPTVSVPLFNAGKLQAAVEMAQARRDQRFVAYQSSVLTALKDVEDALLSFGKEQSRSRALTAAATAYRQAANLSQSLYRAGSSSFLDVLTAERSLYGAEDSLLQSRVLIATGYISLNKALGGGWDGYVDASKPEVVDANTGPHLMRHD